MTFKERFNHWLPKRINVAAITLYPYVLYAMEESEAPSWLRRHEMAHVEQVKRHGWFRFYLSYVMYYVAGRVAGFGHDQSYLSIPWETEARKEENK